MVAPILKWAGGKRQLLSEITARFPAAYGSYHEPFVGAGAVFFALEPDDGWINDRNSRLVTFYEVVREWPEALIEENRSHEHSDEYYYAAREEFNRLHHAAGTDREQAVREASLLLYLNRTCFNGLYRENGDGEFNVPVGDYADPDWVRADQIRAASAVLQGTTVRDEDFSVVEEVADPGDLVYFDPPYEAVSPTADFTDYHAEGFDRADQERLRDVAVRLNEAGTAVVISNSPPVADLYEDCADFSTDLVRATRAINSDGDNRDDVAELLITNVPAADRRRRTLDAYTGQS